MQSLIDSSQPAGGDTLALDGASSVEDVLAAASANGIEITRPLTGVA
jgi:hypothetical protein